MENLYSWGTNGFDGRNLLQKLERLALELGLPAVCKLLLRHSM